MVSLTVAPARAVDLALPIDEKILQALKAKPITRCPHASTQSRCGGAQLQTSPPARRCTGAPRSQDAAVVDQIHILRPDRQPADGKCEMENISGRAVSGFFYAPP
jgi:hypothetical protein